VAIAEFPGNGYNLDKAHVFGNGGLTVAPVNR